MDIPTAEAEIVKDIERINKITKMTFFQRTMDSAVSQVTIRWANLCHGDGRRPTVWEINTNMPRSATIIRSIVEINTYYIWEKVPYENNTNGHVTGRQYDIQSTVMHELMHTIGLAHNVVDPLSAMYGRTHKGNTRRSAFIK